MKVLFGDLPLASVAMRTPRAWPRVVAMLLITLLVACESPEEKEARHYERGVALYEEGEDAKAMVEFRNVLRLNPKSADALYHTGLIHERAGQISGAFGAYRKAVAERPDFVAANVRLGYIALAEQEFDILERAVEAVQKVEPDNPDGLALKGVLLLNRDDVEGARAAAEAALLDAPDHEQASAVLVGALLKERRINAALEQLEEAIARTPESANLLVLKLLVHESQGNSEATAQTFTRLLDLNPSNAAYHTAFARFRAQEGDTRAAEAGLRAALDQASDITEIAADLVRLVYRTEGPEAAVATLKDLIERRPDDTEFRLLLADLYQQQQRRSDAEAVLVAIIERGASMDSTNDARVELARLKLAEGDRENAQTLVAAALSDDASHGGARVLEGTLALEENRLDDAIRSARAALGEDPTSTPALRLAAAVHERKGETDLAIDALASVVELDSKDTRSAERLASLLTTRGDLETALKVWDHVVATAGDPSDALRARAVLALRQGQFNTARADIDRLLENPGQQATATLLRGHLAIADNRPGEAREWFARAETLAPESPDPMISMTHAFVTEGDLEGAIAYLETRTRERPDEAAAFNLKAEMLARAGQLDEAELAWTEAIRIQPTSIISYRRLAQAQLAAGRADEGLATYTTALEKAPDDPKLLYELARAYERNGRFEDAMRTYERLAALTPADDEAVNNYTALVADLSHQDAQSLDRALALAERFRASDNPYYVDTLGWLNYRKGDAAVAATFLNRAVTLAPDVPVFRYHLGMALHASGRKEEALSHLERALSDGADYYGIDEARAMVDTLKAELTSETPSSG